MGVQGELAGAGPQGKAWLTADDIWVLVPEGPPRQISTRRPPCLVAECSRAGRKKLFLSSDPASNPPVNHFALPPERIQLQPPLLPSALDCTRGLPTLSLLCLCLPRASL